jgi:hypothetical protein
VVGAGVEGEAEEDDVVVGVADVVEVLPAVEEPEEEEEEVGAGKAPVEMVMEEREEVGGSVGRTVGPTREML